MHSSPHSIAVLPPLPSRTLRSTKWAATLKISGRLITGFAIFSGCNSKVGASAKPTVREYSTAKFRDFLDPESLPVHSLFTGRVGTTFAGFSSDAARQPLPKRCCALFQLRMSRGLRARRTEMATPFLAIPSRYYSPTKHVLDSFAVSNDALRKIDGANLCREITVVLLGDVRYKQLWV